MDDPAVRARYWHPLIGSQLPLQQSLSTLHVSPKFAHAGMPPVPPEELDPVEPPVPVSPPHTPPLHGSPVQQGLALEHCANWVPHAGLCDVWTQSPSVQVASPTHAPPPLQSPSISMSPAAGGRQAPADEQLLLAQSEATLHPEPSGLTEPKPPPMSCEQHTTHTAAARLKSKRLMRFLAEGAGARATANGAEFGRSRRRWEAPLSTLTVQIVRASLPGR
jgi:hypothetical protein